MITSSPEPHCPVCGYCMTGLPQGTNCPECGEVIDAQEVILYGRALNMSVPAVPIVRAIAFGWFVVWLPAAIATASLSVRQVRYGLPTLIAYAAIVWIYVWRRGRSARALGGPIQIRMAAAGLSLRYGLGPPRYEAWPRFGATRLAVTLGQRDCWITIWPIVTLHGKSRHQLNVWFSPMKREEIGRGVTHFAPWLET